MKRSKYDKYRFLYIQLIEKLSDIPDAKIKALLSAWAKSLAEMDDWVSDQDNPVKKSALTPGLEQGLVDAYYFLSEVGEEYRANSIKIFSRICEESSLSVVTKINEKCKKILNRRKINSETEWNLIRNKIDELSLSNSITESNDIATYQKMLDQFEGF